MCPDSKVQALVLMIDDRDINMAYYVFAQYLLLCGYFLVTLRYQRSGRGGPESEKGLAPDGERTSLLKGFNVRIKEATFIHNTYEHFCK